jgi:lipopolysaccharide export system permease protein
MTRHYPRAASPAQNALAQFVTIFPLMVRRELVGHASVVFSSLLVIWVSILLVRLLGDAAGDRIGADAVLGMVGFSTLNALPTIFVVSLFLGALNTVNRSYRDSEMVIWFASGLSLAAWLGPFLRVALGAAGLIAVLTLLASPWASGQIADYRERYEQRSDVSKVAPGQFRESGSQDRVFFVEADPLLPDRVRNVFVRWVDTGQVGVLVAASGHIETLPDGARFLVLDAGQRHQFQAQGADLDWTRFDQYGLRLEPGSQAIGQQRSARVTPTLELVFRADAGDRLALGELFWRVGLPLAAINLTLLALPLGAVNPRLGKSGNVLMAIVLAMLYLNLVSLAQAWIVSDGLGFVRALLGLHLPVTLLALALLGWRIRRRRVRG